MRVSLFITCFNDTLFPQTGKAAVALLERLGHEIEFRDAQTCCGQMHLNSGYPDEALSLVRAFARIFADADTIVVPSTSCTAMIRTQYPRLAVFELSEFITSHLGITDVGAYFPHRVTYHASCNSLRALALGDGPKSLLRAVKGIEFVDLPAQEECCGFGGTFAIKNAEVSTAMLTDKMRAVLETRAEIVTAGDNSCLMHIAGGLSRAKAGVKAMHYAEILACTEANA
jgi:L-lactate dehydrogenase complex protein LldE